MVDAATVRDLMAENTSEPYVELLTFEAEGEDPGYMALNSVDITSRGRIYTAADVEYTPAKKTGQELSNARITISNVSRELIGIIRQAHEDPTITAELIAVSRPDIVVDADGPFDLFDITFTTASIQAQLGYTRFFDEQFPHGEYTPAYFPAIFA